MWLCGSFCVAGLDKWVTFEEQSSIFLRLMNVVCYWFVLKIFEISKKSVDKIKNLS